MDSNFEKCKKRVYAEKTNINEALKEYNKKLNILPIPAIVFLSVAVGILLIETRWDFGIGAFALVPVIPCAFFSLLSAKCYMEYKGVLNEYIAKIEAIQKEFEKSFSEEVGDDATFSEIKKSKEYKKEIENFFTDAKEPETVVYLCGKTVLISVLALFLCLSVAVAISNSYSFTPQRWKNEPEKRKYMVRDIKSRLNMNLFHDKYNLYSLSEEEIAELFYVEGQETPEIDFKFYSDYETYYAHYMYTEDGINYWVIGIHQGNFWSIDFVETGDRYTGTLGENIDEPPVPLEDRTPLLPENHK